MHSKLSPSSAHRWLSCTASVDLISRVEIKEPDRVNLAADMGTKAHELAEKALLEDTHPSNLSDENFSDAVSVYYEYVTDQLADRMLVEYAIDYTKYNIDGMGTGTADCVLFFEDYIEIVDYKNGVTYVDAESDQLRMYAVGAIENCERENISYIKMTIVQPNCIGHEAVRHAELSISDLFKWRDDILLPTARAIESDETVYVPSESNCKFCPAAGSCRALYEQSTKTALGDFKDIDIKSVDSLSKDEKTLLLNNKTQIISLIKAVEEKVYDEIRSGKQYDEYKLVHAPVRRKFNEDAFDQNSVLYEYLDHEDLFKISNKGILEIEKKLTSKVGKDEAKKIISTLVDKPDPALKLVHKSDKREAVIPAISDFSNIETGNRENDT